MKKTKKDAVKKIEKIEPAPKVETTKAKTKIDKGPSTKFIVWSAWSKKKTIPLDDLIKIGAAVKPATIRTWIGWWKKDINLPAGAKEVR